MAALRKTRWKTSYSFSLCSTSNHHLNYRLRWSATSNCSLNLSRSRWLSSLLRDYSDSKLFSTISSRLESASWLIKTTNHYAKYFKATKLMPDLVRKSLGRPKVFTAKRTARSTTKTPRTILSLKVRNSSCLSSLYWLRCTSSFLPWKKWSCIVRLRTVKQGNVAQ